MNIKYQGFMAGAGGGRLAVIIETKSGNSRYLAEGETLNGWTVVGFSKNTLEIENAEGTRKSVEFDQAAEVVIP